MADPKAGEIIKPVIDGYSLEFDTGSEDMEDVLGEGSREMMAAMFQNLPLRAVISFGNGTIKEEDIRTLLDKINGETQ